MPCGACSALHEVNPNFFIKKSHTGMNVLWWICCIFSEHLTEPILERACMWFFRERAKKMLKRVNKIFENLGKNLQNLKIFWKMASDYVWFLHTINCYKRPCHIMGETGRLWETSLGNYFQMLFNYWVNSHGSSKTLSKKDIFKTIWLIYQCNKFTRLHL